MAAMQAYALRREKYYLPLVKDNGNGVTNRNTRFLLNKNLIPVGYDDEELNGYMKLRTTIKERFPENPEIQTICVHYQTIANVKDRLKIKIHSPYLDALHLLFNETLEIKLIGEYENRVHLETALLPVNLSSHLKSKMKIEENCVSGSDGAYAEDPNAFTSETLYNWMHKSEHEGVLYFSILISAQSIISRLDDDVGDKLKICKRLLTDSIFTDVDIVAKNGKVFPCHTMFLSAHSPILAAMLEKSSPASKKQRIELEIEEESVHALLAYLYSWNVVIPWRYLNTALDLFQVGRKLDIPDLRRKMRKILLQTPIRTFGIRDAFLLFNLAKNSDDCEDLKSKAIQVLTLNSEEFKESEEYRGLIYENENSLDTSEDALELVEIMQSLQT